MSLPSESEQNLPLFLRLRPAKRSEDTKNSWLEEIGNDFVVRSGEHYGFTKVLSQSSQTEVFETCVLPQIEKFLAGKSACIFALGTTGSGKTHTIMGPQSDPGVIRRVCLQLWGQTQDRVQAQPSEKSGSTFELSMYELYNDRFYDLLREGKPQLTLKSSSEGFNIDAMMICPQGAQAAMDLVNQGFTRRAVHATNCNTESSRSHAFIQISTPSAKLVIADLAGSERLVDAGSTGVQRLEAGVINKSLMILGQCIQQLARGAIPSRAAKLTRILLANAHIVPPTIIVALDPYTSAHTGAQILRYASLARQVKGNPLKHKPSSAPGSRDQMTGAEAVIDKERSRARIEALLRRQIVDELDKVYAQRIRQRLRPRRPVK